MALLGASAPSVARTAKSRRPSCLRETSSFASPPRDGFALSDSRTILRHARVPMDDRSRMGGELDTTNGGRVPLNGERVGSSKFAARAAGRSCPPEGPGPLAGPGAFPRRRAAPAVPARRHYNPRPVGPRIGAPRARSSVGERSLHTREVAGSKPAAPTRSSRAWSGCTWGASARWCPIAALRERLEPACVPHRRSCDPIRGDARPPGRGGDMELEAGLRLSCRRLRAAVSTRCWPGVNVAGPAHIRRSRVDSRASEAGPRSVTDEGSESRSDRPHGVRAAELPRGSRSGRGVVSLAGRGGPEVGPGQVAVGARAVTPTRNAMTKPWAVGLSTAVVYRRVTDPFRRIKARPRPHGPSPSPSGVGSRCGAWAGGVHGSPCPPPMTSLRGGDPGLTSTSRATPASVRRARRPTASCGRRRAEGPPAGVFQHPESAIRLIRARRLEQRAPPSGRREPVVPGLLWRRRSALTARWRQARR